MIGVIRFYQTSHLKYEYSPYYYTHVLPLYIKNNDNARTEVEDSNFILKIYESFHNVIYYMPQNEGNKSSYLRSDF